MTVNGHEVSSWDDENVLKLDCVDGAQLYKFTKNPVNGAFKINEVMVCKLYLNKVVKDLSPEIDK